ncbi:Adenylate cyclase, class 2 (thermophilic) [Halalkaliarchaeum sp. AArc-CO]|uniref:class IV adenylate cyclase n=1 Tax=unclassified Halalkaliarchaeum TaxID=2678344 RepID=UPI00217E425A|nr:MULTISPECIES: class IV adenylate cyclase [unclassified Halalkaliarchaeum]MDR5674170.1 class IV adenylate cyclase [Halalkaliarchaeum sp. AArc-GB]UWG50891.1 Adenylate cyclase, class 2 (thermophilic) [Halalkaliarchaeum sp. AArc-CO]
MYEVELKVPATHESVRGRLEKMELSRQTYVEQTDTYYDAPHREFAETDEALRIRRVRHLDSDCERARSPESDPRHDDDVTLTYKGPLVDDVSKTRVERETGVDDGDELNSILSVLGFDPTATVEKRRELFTVDGYTVTLDDVSGLGEFVEVEREAVEADIEEVREGAIDVLESLGLDPEDAIRTSYLELLLERSS